MHAGGNHALFMDKEYLKRERKDECERARARAEINGVQDVRGRVRTEKNKGLKDEGGDDETRMNISAHATWRDSTGARARPPEEAHLHGRGFLSTSARVYMYRYI